ncbi:hypothetical protein SDJN03_21122, partial [Cucurbita argyrosperma subsp. sororia]
MIPSLNQPTDLQFNIHFPKVEAMALNSSCFLSLPSSVRRNHRVPLRIFAYHFCILLLFGAADICQRIALFQTELHSCSSKFTSHRIGLQGTHRVNVYLWELVVVRLLPNFRNEVMKMRNLLKIKANFQYLIYPTGSYPEVLGQITSQNQKLQDGYATADAPISLQSM